MNSSLMTPLKNVILYKMENQVAIELHIIFIDLQNRLITIANKTLYTGTIANKDPIIYRCQ